MNKGFLLLTIFIDILKHKTIFLKNSFVNFMTLSLMIIDKYFVIFVHLLTIMKIASYMMLSRLLDNKSIMKFIKISSHDASDTNKEFNSL